MWPLFNIFTAVAAETPAPLMLPDSVQKARFAETVRRLADFDFDEFLRNMASEMLWVAIKIVIALAIYFIGRWIVRRLVKLLDAAFERRKVDVSLRMFLRKTVRVVFTLILVMIVVQTLGANVTSGGVMILLMKPYRVGDYISAQGQSGTVREIKLFSTVIATNDNQIIYIPNNSIATAIIDNYSTADRRRVDWTIGISYGDDVDVARKAILEILAADERGLREPAPVVWVAALADSSVNLTVRAWTLNADYWSVFYENNERFYKQLPQHGVSFPFPQMDVHVKKE